MKWPLVICFAACTGGDVVEEPRAAIAPRSARVQLPIPRIVRDSDSQHIADVEDRCPNLPEEIEGIEDDYDSCPDDVVVKVNEVTDTVTDDNDHGDVPDAVDRCPDTPSPDDDADDGCPDPS